MKKINISMKDYNSTIRATVREINHEDINYRWFVKSVNTNHAMFGWSYITETLESPEDLFVIHAHEFGDGHSYVTVSIPGATPTEYTGKTVGDDRWSDAKTIDEAIRLAIKSAATRARNLW